VVELGGYGRAMVIDGRVQSTEADECVYHEALILPAWVTAKHVQRVLCLGGANGGMLHRLCALPGVEAVIQVDVDPELYEVSKETLPHMHRDAFADPRCRLLFGHPRELLAALDGQFDLVLADLPDAIPGTHTPALFSREFYAAVRSRLAPGGVYATHAGPANVLDCEFFASVVRTLDASFGSVAPYAVSVPSYGVPWAFAVAGDDLDRSRWDAAAIACRLDGLPPGLLRVYDAETHRHMFSLPRHLRGALAEAGRVITDDRPLHTIEGPAG